MITSGTVMRNCIRSSFAHLKWPTHHNHGSSYSSSNSLGKDSDQLREKVYHCLISSGISVRACEQIITQMPPVYSNLHELNLSLQIWAACQFGPERLSNLLSTHPGLIQRSSNDIKSTFTHLSSLFSQSYVFKILLNAPRVVGQKPSEIDAKLNFLNNNLGIANSQIVNSSCLDHSLTHMRVRSEFLRRCGLFKVASKKEVEVKNPQLSDMFDSSDQQFAKQVAKLSLAEFEAFASLYSMELDDEDEYDDDQYDSE